MNLTKFFELLSQTDGWVLDGQRIRQRVVFKTTNQLHSVCPICAVANKVCGKQAYDLAFDVANKSRLGLPKADSELIATVSDVEPLALEGNDVLQVLRRQLLVACKLES